MRIRPMQTRDLMKAALSALKRLMWSTILLTVVLLAQPYAYAAANQTSGLINFVNDYAGVLTQPELNHLEQTLKAIDYSGGYQAAVVIYPKAPDGVSADNATELADKLLVGSAVKHRGIVFFVFIAEKSIRIEVGYGLEEFVTDALARRTAEQMSSRMTRGEFAGALNEAINRLRPNLDKLDHVKETRTRSEWLPDVVLMTIEGFRGVGFYLAHRSEFTKQLVAWWKSVDRQGKQVLSVVTVIWLLVTAACLRPLLGGLLFLLLPRRWATHNAFDWMLFRGTDASLGKRLREQRMSLDKYDKTFVFADFFIYGWVAFCLVGMALTAFILVVGQPGGFGGAGAWARW